MMVQFWLTVSMVLTIGAYGFYWWGIRRQLVRPNRSSWLIWSAVTTIEALTYQAVNEGLLQNIIFFVNAASCLFITFAIWRQSSWSRPSAVELFCMSLSLGSMVLWLVFHEQVWAHLVVVAAVPIGFLPTWASAIQDKRRELSPAWGFWTLADLSTLLLVVGSGGGNLELPYIIVELVCHGLVWLIIGLGSINPLRSMGSRSGSFLIRELDKSQGNPFLVGESRAGKAVFANRSFPKGATLLQFSGPRYRSAEIFVHRPGKDDRFVQVGPDEYMGPSGDIDDLVNHSCDPNAGLEFREDGIFLVAIQPIQRGDEICWDYSTTSSSSEFFMRCACGTPKCRGVIGDFEFLEPELQAHYRSLNLVPPYLQLGASGSRGPDSLAA